ncbi:MAG: methionyl-tRNA formyltransferase [Eubacteriales bacterium]
MRILFMGTPDFALFSLKALVERGYDVIAAVTQPDKPKGRGYVLTPPPVKAYALEKNIPVYQPASLRTEEFAALLSELNPELIAVVAYGKILPKNVLDYPKYGCVNVHGSLLPKYRGAAPMQRAIIDGKKVTGITTMYMAEGLDTGDMLLRAECEIAENDNFEIIHDRLGALGADLLCRTVDGLKAGKITPIPQDHSKATHTSKITKEDCVIDFGTDADTVHNLIRGLSPIPLAYAHTPDGKLLKIVESEICERESINAEVGKVLSTEGGKIRISCARGSINALKVLPEGKGKMSAGDFIRGRKIAENDILK